MPRQTQVRAATVSPATFIEACRESKDDYARKLHHFCIIICQASEFTWLFTNYLLFKSFKNIVISVYWKIDIKVHEDSVVNDIKRTLSRTKVSVLHTREVENGGTRTQNGGTRTQNGGTRTQNGGMRTQNGGMRTERRDANSERRDANSERRDANSERRDANSERRDANSERRDANSERRDVKSEIERQSHF